MNIHVEYVNDHVYSGIFVLGSEWMGTLGGWQIKNAYT